MDLVESEEAILDDERAAIAAKEPPPARLIEAMAKSAREFQNISRKLGPPPEPRQRPGS
jgi:hypothetical protein